MDPLEEFRKGLEKVSVVRRCPRCNKLSLVFDATKNKLVCTSCGYEQEVIG